MAIDTVPCRETTNLAYADKAFYPARIPVSHWQLRHYISTPEPDLLYYASGHEIYCLNTRTNKRTFIASLPFEARCTSSGYGWICVGGGQEVGHFAAVKLEGAGVEVDRALPLDSDLHWTGGDRPANAGNAGGPVGGRRAASVTIERIGDEIVNSISIHRIQDEEAHLDDIVAVLTNNDKTVRVYSLPAGQETAVLDLHWPVNHATISPDGQTLVAVGDINRAYFFQREINAPIPQIHKPHNRLTSASIDWSLSNVVALHNSEPAATVCYFTTAWSPSGQLIAVGSEGGYITVFDVDALADPDCDDANAVVAVVPSSRPDTMNPHPGAVRSMVFSPEPWDLLIWAEDQGRICIGDLRTGLKSRQVIVLEPKDENLRRLEFEDAAVPDVISRGLDDLDLDYLRRYHQLSDHASSSANFASDYIDARRRAGIRRQQDLASSRLQYVGTSTSAESEDFLHGLTREELDRLESIRTGRQREEAAARAAGTAPRTVNYTTADSFRSVRSRAAGDVETSGGRTRPISEILTSFADPTFPELSRTQAASPRPSSRRGPGDLNDVDTALPSLSSLQNGGWAANATAAAQRTSSAWLARTSEISRLPRRRASVIISPPTTSSTPTNNTPASPSASGTGNGPASSNAGTRATLPSAEEEEEEEEEEENPWRTIEQHMALNLPSQSQSRGPLFESEARARASSPLPAEPTSPSSMSPQAQLQADLAAERARITRALARQPRLRSVHTADPQRLPGFPALISQNGELRRVPLRGGYNGPDAGVRTAGLAMSADGRTLWAACEEGIFEIRIGVKGRLFWPAVEPR